MRREIGQGRFLDFFYKENNVLLFDVGCVCVTCKILTYCLFVCLLLFLVCYFAVSALVFLIVNTVIQKRPAEECVFMHILLCVCVYAHSSVCTGYVRLSPVCYWHFMTTVCSLISVWVWWRGSIHRCALGKDVSFLIMISHITGPNFKYRCDRLLLFSCVFIVSFCDNRVQS